MSLLCRTAVVGARRCATRTFATSAFSSSTLSTATAEHSLAPSHLQSLLDESNRIRFMSHIISDSRHSFHDGLGCKKPDVWEQTTALNLTQLAATPASSAALNNPYVVRIPVMTAEGLQADSTKRKRAKKMNKHKWKKRLKEQRRRSRKDMAQ